MKIDVSDVEVKIRRDEFSWSGEMLVNGDFAAEATGPSLHGVLDGLWGAFWDEVGSDSVFTSRDFNDASSIQR